MPLIRRFPFGYVKVFASPREHPPAHFHIFARDGAWEFKVEIETLRAVDVRGSVPRKFRTAVMDWATLEREHLMALWRRYNEDG